MVNYETKKILKNESSGKVNYKIDLEETLLVDEIYITLSKTIFSIYTY